MVLTINIQNILKHQVAIALVCLQLRILEMGKEVCNLKRIYKEAFECINNLNLEIQKIDNKILIITTILTTRD
jgi:hypothetical protein